MARLDSLGVLATHMLCVHSIYLSDADVKRFDPKRNLLVFCPYSQLQFAFPAHVASWTENRLRWSVATDCSSSNDSMNVQKELRFVAGTRLGPVTASSEYERFRHEGSKESAELVDRLRTRLLKAARSWRSKTSCLAQSGQNLVTCIPPRCGVIEPDARSPHRLGLGAPHFGQAPPSARCAGIRPRHIEPHGEWALGGR